MGFEVVEDQKNKKPDPIFCEEIIERAKEYKLLVGKTGPNKNIVLFAPPLSIGEEDIQFVLETVEAIFEASHQNFVASG